VFVYVSADTDCAHWRLYLMMMMMTMTTLMCVELPSSYAELNAVFDVYDVTLSGHINYRELVKTVDRQVHIVLTCTLFVYRQTTSHCR